MPDKSTISIYSFSNLFWTVFIYFFQLHLQLLGRTHLPLGARTQPLSHRQTFTAQS